MTPSAPSAPPAPTAPSAPPAPTAPSAPTAPGAPAPATQTQTQPQAQNGEPGVRVLFLNSIGGLEDTFLIPHLMEAYRRKFPEDTLLLYDSLCLDHYYEKPDYIDEIIPAQDHFASNGMAQIVRACDPELQPRTGRPVGMVAHDRMVETHRAFFRQWPIQGMCMQIDYDTTLCDLLNTGYFPMNLTLRAEHQEKVRALLDRINPDGRPLAGVYISLDQQDGRLSQSAGAALREMGRIAEGLCDQYGARVLFSGDAKPFKKQRYLDGDWIDLDDESGVLFHLIEVMARCELFVGLPGGFWETVNLMRPVGSAPALQVFGTQALYEGKVRPRFRNYLNLGKKIDLAWVQATARDNALPDFIRNRAQSADAVLAFIAERQYLTPRTEAQS